MPLDVFVGVKPDDTTVERIGPSSLWEEKGGRIFFFLKSDGPQVFAISSETLSFLFMTQDTFTSFERLGIIPNF